MRYALLVAVLAGLIAASSAASAPAPTTTLKVDWNETKTFEGGQLKLRVTRLVVQGPRWTVAASITNRSTRTIHIDSVTYPSARIAGMAVAYQIPPAGGYGFGAVPRINVLPMRSARPRIPALLGPGQTWNGTFSSFAVLPRDKALWVIFGWFSPDGSAEDGFNHITEHAFRLKR